MKDRKKELNTNSIKMIRRRIAQPVYNLANLIEGDSIGKIPTKRKEEQEYTQPKKSITEEDMVRKIKFYLSIPIHEGETTSISKFMDSIIEQEIKRGKENVTRQLQYKYKGVLNSLLLNLEDKSKVKSEHTIQYIVTCLENEKV